MLIATLFLFVLTLITKFQNAKLRHNLLIFLFISFLIDLPFQDSIFNVLSMTRDASNKPQAVSHILLLCSTFSDHIGCEFKWLTSLLVFPPFVFQVLEVSDQEVPEEEQPQGLAAGRGEHQGELRAALLPDQPGRRGGGGRLNFT